MSDALSDRTIEIVKATVPALEKGGTAITDRMYQRLFTTPEIRDLFNQSHHGETGSQSKALTAAIIAYARNIDNLGVLGTRVERITQKHVGLNILPEHYHFVAEALLGAIKDVLGEAATPEILEAWGEAYWFLADLLIAREAIIYSRLAAAAGGWNGWRDFRVESTKQESEVIRSFVLVPADGRGVMRHRPGQYLTFSFDVPGAGHLKRNYSISSAPEDRAYRISVKREARPGVPPGLASNWLHDQAKPGTVLKVAPPAGEFYLDERDQSPVVSTERRRRTHAHGEHAGTRRALRQRPAHLVHSWRGESSRPRDGRACARTRVAGAQRHGPHVLQRGRAKRRSGQAL